MQYDPFDSIDTERVLSELEQDEESPVVVRLMPHNTHYTWDAHYGFGLCTMVNARLRKLARKHGHDPDRIIVSILSRHTSRPVSNRLAEMIGE